MSHPEDLEKIRQLLLTGEEANAKLAVALIKGLKSNFKAAMEALGFDRFGFRVVKDFERLRGNVYSCAGRGLRDLEPFRGGLAHINSLNCSGNELSSLEIVAQFRNLRWLSLSGNPIADLAPLRALEALEVLYIDRTAVSDLAPLAGMSKLREAMFWQTKVTDLSPLNDCYALSNVYAGDTVGIRLDTLRHPNIFDLRLGNSQLRTLDGLAVFPRVYLIVLANNVLEDISALSAQKSLRSVDLSYNRLTSLEALRDLPELNTVRCHHNPELKSIEPLFSLPKIQHLVCDAAISALEIKELKRLHPECRVDAF